MEANNASDSSSDDSSDTPPTPPTRKKRDIAWCAVDDTDNAVGNIASTSKRRSHRYHPPVKVVWPPPSNATTSQWPKMRHYGNPYLGTKMQLYSQTGHHLAVYPDGKVRGTPDDNDLHTYLEVISAGHPGHVRVKGLLTNLYVAMDERGRLYGEPLEDTATVFVEAFQGSYNTYLSLNNAHLGWYLGLKKSGKFKKGPKTGHGQRAIKFLPRRDKFQ